MTLRPQDIQLLDRMSEALYKMIHGECPSPVEISGSADENEVCQVVSYFNGFISVYNEFSECIFSISRGELSNNIPKGHKLFAVQALKSLQSNLRHLTWKTQRIAGGDFEQRVDFMGEFSAAFNKMTADLKSAFDRIETQKRQLEKLSAMKDQFLAVASHDLRTPFNAILGFSNFLLQDKTLGEEQHEMVRMIKDGAETQLEYINDLLDVMKLEAGEVKLKFQSVSIKTLVEECVEGLRMLVESKGIKFLILNNFPELFPEIEVDVPKIKQVLNNLISNAMKFTESGKKITVSCFINGSSEIEIHVIDEGVGIAEKSMPELFMRYKQFRNTGTSGEKGTGLGLFICKTFIEAHGGEIAVNSVIGNGSDFYFKLPAIVHKATSGCVESEAGEPFETEFEKMHAGNGNPHVSPNILIVDDDYTCRKLIEKMITTIKCGTPHLTDSCGSALKALDNEVIDIIFMDIQLSDINGFETAAVIRSREKQYKRRIPIIALTSFSDSDIMKKCRESGIDDFILKPVSVGKIVECINKYSIN